jgi:hypothetical protein
MHATNAGEKRKSLKKAASVLARDADVARNAAESSPEAGEKARKLQAEADKLKAEAEALKETARLEDLAVWKIVKEKSTKKGSREYAYWMISWREGGKVRNAHLGSCEKLSREDALQKAKKMKAEALGMVFCHSNNLHQ